MVREAEFLDPGHLARDFLEHLAAPFFAGGDRVDGGDGFGAARAANVDDSEVCGLLGSEAEKHRLGFFAVACLYLFVSFHSGLFFLPFPLFRPFLCLAVALFELS